MQAVAFIFFESAVDAPESVRSPCVSFQHPTYVQFPGRARFDAGDTSRLIKSALVKVMWSSESKNVVKKIKGLVMLVTEFEQETK